MGKFKAFLTIISGFTIVLELFEEAFEEIPFFKKYHKHVKLSHGVLILTISHMLHMIFELMEELEKHHEIDKERSRFKQVQLLPYFFISEEEFECEVQLGFSVFGRFIC
jgi:hypothetical protein